MFLFQIFNTLVCISYVTGGFIFLIVLITFIVLIVLSIHSVFTGMAVGVMIHAD